MVTVCLHSTSYCVVGKQHAYPIPGRPVITITTNVNISQKISLIKVNQHIQLSRLGEQFCEMSSGLYTVNDFIMSSIKNILQVQCKIFIIIHLMGIILTI